MFWEFSVCRNLLCGFCGLCIGNFLFAGICCLDSVVSVICAGKFICFVVTVICYVAQNQSYVWVVSVSCCIAQNHMNVLGHCNLLCDLCNLSINVI